MIRRITGRKKKMAKPSPTPSVEPSYTEIAAQLAAQFASISNDPLIFRAPVDDLSIMNSPDTIPASFDSAVSSYLSSPSALFHLPGSTLSSTHYQNPVPRLSPYLSAEPTGQHNRGSSTWLLNCDPQLRPSQLGCQLGIFTIDAARMSHHRSYYYAAKK